MNNKTLSYIFAGLLVLLISTGLFVTRFNNQKKENSAATTVATTVAPTMRPTEGYLRIVSNDIKKIFNRGEKISLDLEASSMDKNIVGYDIILSYDPLAFDFVSVDTAISDYKIYSYKRDGYITLTAMKNLSSTPSPLKGKIASLVFKSLKQGIFKFSLKPSIGLEKTNFVTDKTEVLNPELNEIDVTIK